MTPQEAKNAYWSYNKAKNKAKKQGNLDDLAYFEQKESEAYAIWKGL